MNELQMFDKLERALDREEIDDHLSFVEREEIVGMFLSFYGSDEIEKTYPDFPISGTVDEKFCYILYDFYGA